MNNKKLLFFYISSGRNLKKIYTKNTRKKNKIHSHTMAYVHLEVLSISNASTKFCFVLFFEMNKLKFLSFDNE